MSAGIDGGTGSAASRATSRFVQVGRTLGLSESARIKSSLLEPLEGCMQLRVLQRTVQR